MDKGLGIALIAGLGLWLWSKSKAAAKTLPAAVTEEEGAEPTAKVTKFASIPVTNTEAGILKAAAGTPEAAALVAQIKSSTELQALKAEALAKGWTNEQLSNALASNPTALAQAVALAPYENAAIRVAIDAGSYSGLPAAALPAIGQAIAESQGILAGSPAGYGYGYYMPGYY